MESVEFTVEEKRLLAAAITKAAVGIAECWDVLSGISDRIGRYWEPTSTSVADIADITASGIDNPSAIEMLDADSVAECFEDSENWTAETEDEMERGRR